MFSKWQWKQISGESLLKDKVERPSGEALEKAGVPLIVLSPQKAQWIGFQG